MLNLLLNPMLPFLASSSYLLYKNWEDQKFKNVFSSRENFKKFAILAAKELGVFAVCFIVYPATLMPIFEKITMPRQDSIIYKLPAKLQFIKFSNLTPGSVIGLMNAYYNYQMWVDVDKQLYKKITDINSEKEKIKKSYDGAIDKNSQIKPENKEATKQRYSRDIDERFEYADKQRQFFITHPYIIPCLKCASVASLTYLSLFHTNRTLNSAFIIIPVANYLISSAINHYLTAKAGDPLLVQVVKIPVNVAKSIYNVALQIKNAVVEKASNSIRFPFA